MCNAALASNSNERLEFMLQREQFEKTLEAGTGHSLPRNQRIEDGVDFGTQPAPTLATPIPTDNKGYLLLQKMGWKTGTGLGKGEDGACCWPTCISIMLSPEAGCLSVGAISANR